MSYILEALQRAQAQREQGQVPGLHAQPLPQAPTPRESMRRLWWIGAVVLIAAATLTGLLLWKGRIFDLADGRLTAPGSAASQAAITATAPTQTPAAPPAPPALLASAPSPFAVGGSVAAVAVTVTPPPPSPPSPPQMAAKPAAPALPSPAAKAIVAPPAIPSEKASAAVAPLQTTTASTTAASASSEPPRIYTQAELPDEVRRDLPKLAVSGSVYSSNPTQRMLVLNGQVVQEGGTPGGDVVLEQIRPKSAVLRFRGYRYSLDF